MRPPAPPLSLGSGRRCRESASSPRRRTPLASAHAVLLLVALEVLLVGLEMRRALPVCEVKEEVRLGRIDARGQRGFARVADGAGRQSGVDARVVWRVELQLRESRLGGQA